MNFLFILYIVLVVGVVLFLISMGLNILIMLFSGEKICLKRTYSFKWVAKFLVTAWCIASLITAFIYMKTDSYEVALTLYAFMIACIVAGILRVALIEYQAKRRGAKKA